MTRNRISKDVSSQVVTRRSSLLAVGGCIPAIVTGQGRDRVRQVHSANWPVAGWPWHRPADGEASAAGTVSGSLGRTRWSWLRELMPSLVKTLRRWYWTVRELMNSRAPISGLDRPSRASRATWASWAVSASPVSRLRLRTVSPVASSSRRARSANASMPIASSISWAVRNCSRASAAPVLAAQPLAVEQVRAGQLGADAGPAQPLDRLAVAPLGRLALAEQGADPGLDPQHPLGRGHAGAFGQPLQSGREELHVAGPGRRLGQLGHDMGPVPHRFAFECPPRGVVCGGVLPEAVVQHRARVVRPADQGGRGACGRLPRDGLDQLRRLLLPAPPGREHHRGIRNGRVPGRLRDQVIFFDQPRRRGQLAGENVGSGQVVERERQVHERAGVAGELDLAERPGHARTRSPIAPWR